MWLLIFILSNVIIGSQSQFDFDFDPPCSCEGSYCECCLRVDLIGQEGCIRVTLNNNQIRFSVVLNGDELGGFSTPLGIIPDPNGFGFTVPCLPNTNLALRLRYPRTRNSRRSSRLRSSGRRFCLNLSARRLRRRVYNRDFCFNANGNTLTAVRRR